MKSIRAIITTILLPALLTACAGSAISTTEEGGSKAAAVDTSFYQRWVHSYEEQNGQKIPNIFRPAGSRAFPPSRFRMEFAFDTSGQCNYKYLSPVDAHEMRDCVYTKIGNKVYIYDQAGVLLKHLSFTLERPASIDEMRMAYGVQEAVSKDAKTTPNAKPQ